MTPLSPPDPGGRDKCQWKRGIGSSSADDFGVTSGVEGVGGGGGGECNG